VLVGGSDPDNSKSSFHTGRFATRSFISLKNSVSGSGRFCWCFRSFSGLSAKRLLGGVPNLNCDVDAKFEPRLIEVLLPRSSVGLMVSLMMWLVDRYLGP
jgi:hypothetical protein